MTQSQFCNMIVDKFCKENNIPKPENLKDLAKHQYVSSGLAVALEHLGCLENTDYSSTRGGTAFIYWDGEDVHTLSIREIIELLPIYE